MEGQPANKKGNPQGGAKPQDQKQGGGPPKITTFFKKNTDAAPAKSGQTAVQANSPKKLEENVPQNLLAASDSHNNNDLQN